MAGSMSKVQIVQSGLPSEEQEFVWTIDNFNFVTASRKYMNMKVLSFPFSAGEKIDMLSKWRLYFTIGEPPYRNLEAFFELMDHSGVSDQPFIATAEIRTDITDKIHTADYDNDEYNCLRCRIPTHDFNRDESVVACSFTKLTTVHRFILTPCHLHGYVNEVGALNLHIKFKLYGSTSPSVPDRRVVTESALGECSNLHKIAMLSMLKNGEGADVIFKTKDGQEIKAHKCILSAHSVVFKAMLLDSEMKEKKDGIVELTDIGSDGLKIFLKYLYTGDVDEKWSDVYKEIINAADKYQVKLLKDACDRMLFTICTKDNCFQLLQVANLHNLSIAEDKIEKFISKDPGLLMKLSRIVFQEIAN